MSSLGPAVYTVEVQFGSFGGVPVWQDITAYVNVAGAALQITRGRSDAASQVSPGRVTCELFNDDGRFTPGRAGSPYFPYVVDGAPVRVTVRVPSLDGNLEDNPSHEYGIGEWSGGSFTGTAPTIQQLVYGGGVGSGGENALVVTWASQAVGSLVQRRIYGLTPGQQYTWSRRVYTATGGPDPFLLIGDGGLFTSGAATSTKNAWVTISVTFVATQPSHTLQLWTNSSASGGITWTDNGRGDVGAVALPFTTDKVGAVKIDRFTGKALEWPVGWSGTPGRAASTQFVAVDVLDQLGDHAGQLRAFDVEEPLLDNPTAFLPLDEPAGATQAGNVGSDPRAAVLVNPGGSGALDFGGSTGPAADGTSAPTFTPAGTNNGFYLRAPTSVFAAAATLEAFINTSVTGGVILNAAVPKNGDPYIGYGMSLRVEPGTGRLQWNSDGGLQVTSSTSVANGQTHHVAAVYQHTGSQHVATLYVDGLQVASGAVPTPWVLVMANWFLIGGGSKLQLFAGTINHAGLYGSALTADRLRAHALAGLTGFGGERADQRISRLAAYSGLVSLTPANRLGVWVLDDASLSILGSSTVLAAADVTVDAGSSTIWGQAAGGFTPLAGMQDVTATEGGLVLADRSGFLDSQARSARYNQAPAVQIDLADGGVQPTLTVIYNNADVVNDSTMTTQDGSKVRYVDQASVGQRGTYAGGQQLLTRDSADAYSAAAWQVTHKTAPQPRYTSIEIDVSGYDPVSVVELLRADVGSRLDLLNLPDQAPTPSAVLFAEGYTETVSTDSGVRLVFNTSAGGGYQVWTLDHPFLSVLDSTTVLAW